MALPQPQSRLEVGFSVLGIFHVDDSATCGVNIPSPCRSATSSSWNQTELSWDNLDFNELIARLPDHIAGAKGRGAFGGALRDELKARGINVPFIGFSPTRIASKRLSTSWPPWD